ncbi:MAG TPA: ATP-binding protein [Planctomycetota bacterium]|nr:ATP-binding protein [Planctomycetota bacterium]
MQTPSLTEVIQQAAPVLTFCGPDKAHFGMYQEWVGKAGIRFRWGGTLDEWFARHQMNSPEPRVVCLRRRDWLEFTARGLQHTNAAGNLVLAKDWRTQDLLDALHHGWIHLVAQPFTPPTFVSNVKWLLEPMGDPTAVPGKIQPVYVSPAQVELELTVGDSNRGMEFLVGQWVEQFLRGRVKSVHVRHTRLAAGELLSNAIEWGNRMQVGSTVQTQMVYDGARVMLKMTDQGHGFNVTEALNDNRDPTTRMRARIASGKRPGGFGIVLVKRLMDSLNLQEGGRVAVATLHV